MTREAAAPTGDGLPGRSTTCTCSAAVRYGRHNTQHNHDDGPPCGRCENPGRRSGHPRESERLSPAGEFTATLPG
jgi:hypothetical protein